MRDTRSEGYDKRKKKPEGNALRAKRIMEEAAAHGVIFLLDEYLPRYYEIRVKGEKGVLRGVPLNKLPTLLHGLYLMGDKLRALRMRYKFTMS